MSKQDGLSPAERELETALRSLAPAAVRLEAVAAAFEAGRRSVRRQVRLWQSAAAAMLLVVASVWLSQAGHVRVALTEREPSTLLADSARATQPRAEQSLFMLRQAVWEKGVDGLPAVQLPPSSSTRANGISFIPQGES
jgi:hypothetical protein